MIFLVIVLSVLFSSVSCKRSAENETGQLIIDNAQESVESSNEIKENYTAGGETEGTTQVSGESTDSVDNENSSTADQTEATQPTQGKVEQIIAEEQTPGIEVSNEIKELIDLKDYEYVNEDGLVLPTAEGKNKNIDKYKYIRATREHILSEQKYVYQKVVGGVTKYFTDLDSFKLEFDVTEQIKDEAVEFVKLQRHYIKEDTASASMVLEEYEGYMQEGETVVLGHFEPQLGKHVICYERFDNSDNRYKVNFKVTDQYTLIPFTVDKVYGESDFKVGDTLSVRYSRYLQMNLDTNGYEINHDYTFFDDCSLEERSYITSLVAESDGSYSTGIIFQKALLESNIYDYDTPKSLLDDVAAKYS